MRYLFTLLLVFWSFCGASQSLSDSSKTTTFNPKRLKALAITGGVGYGLTMTGLSLLWYDNLQGFRFFDDNKEWHLTDKVGHFYTAFQFSRATEHSLRWAGVSERKARLWAGITGMVMMTPIEILDGFSPTYGASWGDMIANSTGAMFLFGQSVLWKETRIYPKFSFAPSGLAAVRPNLLGSNLMQQIIKDYNGQTYWLSIDLDKFVAKRKFPKFLNIAVGYGIGDMVAAEHSKSIELGYEPYQEYYLGLDFDFSYLKPRKRIAKIGLYLLSLVRIPAPTFAYSSRYGARWHWLYF